MLGGAIHKPSASEPVIVRHSEEVVCTNGGVVPKPKDHLTNVELTPTVSEGHPIRLINLTTGVRTQLTTNGDTIDGTQAIAFTNPKAGASAVATEYGDHIRIFWEEVIENDTGAETAVEVTISPDTLENPGEVSIIKITNCWELLCA